MLNRRDFLRVAGAAAISAPFVPQISHRPLKNFVWLRPSLTKSPDDWKRDLALMRESGIAGIVAEVYNGSNALFRSRRLPVRAEWLESILPIAAAEGVEVHAWMWCMPCLLSDVIRDHPDWYNVNAKGESAVDKPAYVSYYKFLDPARPEVREFVQGTVKELAAIPGLTGVHLDYIRHPDAILPSGLWSNYGIVQDKVYPPYDYGYTDYSRRRSRPSTASIRSSCPIPRAIKRGCSTASTASSISSTTISFRRRMQATRQSRRPCFPDRAARG